MSVTTRSRAIIRSSRRWLKPGWGGYPRTDDLSGYQQEGFGPMDRTVTPQGRRASTARVSRRARSPEPDHPHPCADRSHYFCRQARGGRRGLEGESTIPSSDGQQEVLCAGAMPRQILQRAPAWVTRSCSGSSISRWCTISPAWENLQDHLEMYLQYECKAGIALPALVVEPAEESAPVAVRRHRHRRSNQFKRAVYPQPRKFAADAFSTTSCRWRLTTMKPTR